MGSAALTQAWVLTIVLFAIGLAGLLARRNLVFMLMSVEIMLNAAGLAFITAGARWAQADGQVMFILILTLAASEVAVGLALILHLFSASSSVDADSARALRD